MSARLPFRAAKAWRWRWLLTRSGARLHRIAAYEQMDRDGLARVMGARTACGRIGDLLMPGVLSRIGAPRCRRCCRATGVPQGNGAPHNAGMRDR